MNKMVTPVLLSLAFMASSCDAPPETTATNEDVVIEVFDPRPRFEITEMQAYDPSTVAPYASNHDEIYAHIDAHRDEHLENLRRWVRQPSISAQNVGIQEMAELLRSDLEVLGFQETTLVPSAGHPGVWGFYDAGAEKTLVLYMMYDVQPVNPEDWQVPPFAGDLVDHKLGKVLMARGVTNQKGPERALLNAISSILAVDGTLPVNIMVLAEGEEELGSPNYPEIISQYEDRLKTADGALFPFNSQRPNGEININLGVKGIIYFELEAHGNKNGGPMVAEIHGSNKARVDSPVWQLTQALASMTSADGNTILIPGYYDQIRGPNKEEQRLINGLVATQNDAQVQELLGVDHWIDGMEGKDAILRYLYDITLNIDGIWAGYTGEGTKTILPHKATAKLDSRLPPDVDPKHTLQLVRNHLDSNGFEDIEMRVLSSYPAAQTSVESDLAQAAISVINKWSVTKAVSPRLAGSAPFYQFTKRLELPMFFSGLGHGSGAHAPNEYMVIEPVEGSGILGLSEIEKSYVDLLFALSKVE